MPDSISTTAGRVTHKGVLAIAVPIMLSNVSTPLIGVVDTAVVGQLASPHYIGAVAVGGLIFSFLFWSFGVLRRGTTVLTAQALGAGDAAEIRATLGRALLIAVVAGALLILAQQIIAAAAFGLVQGSSAVETEAKIYYAIRIWSAPAALVNYALLGWFIGLGRAPTALVLQLVLNVTNIALDAFFVLGLDMTADGVALGTVIAELFAAGVGLWLMARELRRIGGQWSLSKITRLDQLRRTLSVNLDIMIRTLCLIFAFSVFTAQGAAQGDVLLAANEVLLHLFALVAYALDGFAFAAETLVGQAVGAQRRDAFDQATRKTTQWAVGTGLAIGVVILTLGGYFIDLMSVSPPVRETARIYLFWAALASVTVAGATQLDGIFIGATRTADMRNMMIVSLAAYLAAWWVLAPVYANHGLWAALIVFVAMRATTLGLRFGALRRDAFAPAGPLRAK